MSNDLRSAMGRLTIASVPALTPAFVGASPAPTFVGASPAPTFVGASPAPAFIGASPAPTFVGASPAPTFVGAGLRSDREVNGSNDALDRIRHLSSLPGANIHWLQAVLQSVDDRFVRATEPP